MQRLHLTSKDITSLRNNINTGIEYEYALFYCLLTEDDKSVFQKEILNYHPHNVEIKQIIANTNIDVFFHKLKDCGYFINGYKLATQDDSVGPADIVLYCIKGGQPTVLGISVKYNNTCTCNCSYHYFLTQEDKDELKRQLPAFVDRHIHLMKHTYGTASNWFRNRTCTSPVTNEYIDLIRSKVVVNWDIKTEKEKLEVLSTLLQMVSPIPYWVYTYMPNPKDNTIDTTPFHIKVSDVNQVKLSKNAGQFVRFHLRDTVFAQMQIKFNNGILERYKGKRNAPDVICDGIAMKFGDAFGSWNFSLLK